MGSGQGQGLPIVEEHLREIPKKLVSTSGGGLCRTEDQPSLPQGPHRPARIEVLAYQTGPRHGVFSRLTNNQCSNT